jgi:hypothetical protein
MSDSTTPDDKRRRRWLLLILLLLLLVFAGICGLSRNGEEIAVNLVVFGDPLGDRTVPIDVVESGNGDASPLAMHTFTEPGKVVLDGIDTTGQYWVETSVPSGCESVPYAGGVEQDLALGDGWDNEGAEFEGGAAGTVVVVCGGYHAETVFRLVSQDGSALPADIELRFEVLVDPENPALSDDLHEGAFSSEAPFTLLIQPGQVEVSIVGDPVSGETVDEVLAGVSGGPCRLISPQHLSLTEIALQQTAPVDVEVSCAGEDPSTPSTATTVQESPDATGNWIFRVHVTGVEGSVCQGEIGEKYEREVTISGPDDAIVVVGLDDLDDPRDPAWIGTYSAGKLVFGGTRAEDDGTTTATFEMTLSDDGSLLDGNESWTWDWTSRGETGTCTQGTSTVSATRVP